MLGISPSQMTDNSVASEDHARPDPYSQPAATTLIIFSYSDMVTYDDNNLSLRSDKRVASHSFMREIGLVQ